MYRPTAPQVWGVLGAGVRRAPCGSETKDQSLHAAISESESLLPLDHLLPHTRHAHVLILAAERHQIRQLRTWLQVCARWWVSGREEDGHWAGKVPAGELTSERCLVPACPLQHLHAPRASKSTSSPRGHESAEWSTYIYGHMPLARVPAMWDWLLEGCGDPEVSYPRRQVFLPFLIHRVC